MSKMSLARSGMVAAFERLEDLGVVAQHAADRVLGRIVPLADHLLELRCAARGSLSIWRWAEKIAAY